MKMDREFKIENTTVRISEECCCAMTDCETEAAVERAVRCAVESFGNEAEE
ncbi:MAG: hypothetical protein HFE62_03265 [Firmicutes bacterium]|nr:hypothetical protein [Bacillota bacterium]